jgi:hypothetical protein
MKKRFYVGCKEGKREVFKFHKNPEWSDNLSYLATIGPFRTKAGANYMALYGGNNPHCQCVADAERLALIHKGQSELCANYATHLDKRLKEERKKLQNEYLKVQGSIDFNG